MVIVTGGSGFVGKYVVRQLFAENKKVLVITRDERKYHRLGDEIVVEGSLADMEALRTAVGEQEIETCIHLAWEGIPDYSYEMSEKNLRHGLNVLGLCKSLSIKNLVITGSCWEYKDPAGEVSVSHATDASNAFQAAKNSLHGMAQAFCKENGIRLNWLRLFYVYGPGQRSGSLLPHILESFAEGGQPELNGACNENDFVYVEDVAEAIVRCADRHGYPETLNVGSGCATRVLEVVKMAAEEYGASVDTAAYQKTQGISYYAAADEMENGFGWRAKTDMKTGIRKMVEAKRKDEE